MTLFWLFLNHSAYHIISGIIYSAPWVQQTQFHICLCVCIYFFFWFILYWPNIGRENSILFPDKPTFKEAKQLLVLKFEWVLTNPAQKCHMSSETGKGPWGFITRTPRFMQVRKWLHFYSCCHPELSTKKSRVLQVTFPTQLSRFSWFHFQFFKIAYGHQKHLICSL